MRLCERERMSERVRLEFIIYIEIRRDINPLYYYYIIMFAGCADSEGRWSSWS